MKKSISIVLIGLLFITGVYAEKTIIDEVFDKYAKIESASVVDINGFLLKFAAKHDDELKNLNLSGIKILTIEDPEVNKDINFYQEIVPNLKLSEYKELMRVHEKDQQVIMLAKESNKKIEEFLIIVGGSDNTIVRIKGELNSKDFDQLAGMADVNIKID